MAKVVNYMILLLIFVFDPLAIALVLVTNKVFQLEGAQAVFEPKTNFEPSNETPTTIIDVIKEKTKENELDENTVEVKTYKEELPIPEEVFISEQEPIIPEEQHDDTKTNIVEEDTKQVSKKQPVIPTGKIEVEEIKEKKEGNRGFSVEIPNPKSTNTIERIGSNKIVKNGDNNKVFFKRG
jgi:hypothetical protein